MKPIGNRKSEIENHETHPLPRGGTDLMPPQIVFHTVSGVVGAILGTILVRLIVLTNFMGTI
jgi:hypothetical protein